MSVLAFKAIGYGAEQIPDKFFEKIPGGFFKPEEEKKKKGKNSRSPPKEKSSRNSERSRREHSPQNDYSDYSGHDTDYEKEQSRKERRRRKSTGRSTSRSLSRGRDKQRSRNLDGEYSDRDMAYAEQGQGQGPYFPPPPTSEYRPYDSQEHASRPSQDDYRPMSAQPQHGYPTQVNSPFRSRSATVPMMASHPSPVNSCPPLLLKTPFPNSPSPFAGLQPHLFDHLRRGTPISASFSPSYEPPLAAILHRPPTNTPQPAYAQTFPTQPSVNRRDGTSPPAVAYGDEAAHRYEEMQHAKAGQAQQARSGSAARYTPGPGYAPSPVVMPAATIPPPPVGVNSPPVGTSAPYAPYNPATYAPTTLVIPLPATVMHPRHSSTASNHIPSPPSTSISMTLPTILVVPTSKSPSTTTASPQAAVAVPSTTAESIGIELGLQIPAILVVKVLACLTCVEGLMTWICAQRISGLR